MVSVKIRENAVLVLQTAVMVYWGGIVLDGRERAGGRSPEPE